MVAPNPVRWLTSGTALEIWVKVLLLSEVLMLIVWVVLFGVLESYDEQTLWPDLYYARTALLFSLLGHLGTPLTLTWLGHEMEKGTLRWERWFWMLGNLFTDIWSATDAWRHLGEKSLPPEALGMVRGFTTTALVLSSIGVITYLIVLLLQAVMPETTTAAENTQIQEPLIPALLQPPRVKPITRSLQQRNK